MAARTVGVEGPNHDGGRLVAAPEGACAALTVELGGAVDGVRVGGVLFGHRHLLGRAVDLARRRVHHALDLGRARLGQDRQGAARVDVEVLEGRVDRVPHAEAGEVRRKLRAYAPELSDGQVLKEGGHTGILYDDEPVGLLEVGGERLAPAR